MDSIEGRALPALADPRRGDGPRAARAVAHRSPLEPTFRPGTSHDRREPGGRTALLQARIEALSRELARRDGALLTLLRELREPVMPLLGAARVLRRGVGVEERDAMVQVIERQSLLLERLLDEAAAAARPCGRLAPCPCVLQESLRLALGGWRAEAGPRRQSLELVLPARPVIVRADPERLQQMLASLMSNASACTPSGGRVTVSVSVEGGMAVARIDDDGIGVAPDRLASLFEPLACESDDAPAAEGLPIGLAAVRRLAGQHGGGLEARGAGQCGGSQFILCLPLDAGSSARG
jgi:signal transduction histidine kinase